MPIPMLRTANLTRILFGVLLGMAAAALGAIAPAVAQDRSVVTYHGDVGRSGAYVVPGLTWERAGALHLDAGFHASFPGHVYAQPLYWRESGSGSALLIVVTEDDGVHALDAVTGKPVWDRALGKPVPLDLLPCGNIDPLGITGTPVIDEASQAIFLDAERRYRAVDPDNRLVARGLEREWEERLSALEAAKAELSRRQEARPRALSQDERSRLLALGADLAAVWHAATTTPRDRKELLRTLLEEVIVKVERDKATARLTLRWKGGALAEIDLALPRSRPATIRTDEDTIALVRRLAALYPDAVIAGILNRQGRTTAYGHRFEAGRVASLRRHWDIPCFEPSAAHAEGELLTIKTAVPALGVAPSTLHRLLNAGIIPGEQLTPGAPWRIRLTDDVMARFNNDAGEGFMPMREAMRALGVSRQTVLQRVKRGELDAVHVMRGKQKGLRIKAVTRQPELFDRTS